MIHCAMLSVLAPPARSGSRKAHSRPSNKPPDRLAMQVQWNALGPKLTLQFNPCRFNMQRRKQAKPFSEIAQGMF